MVPLKWRLKFSSIKSSACPRFKNSTTNQSFMEQTAYKKWKLWPESAFHFLRVKTSYAPHQGRRKVWKCGRVSSNVVVWIGLTHPLKSWGGGGGEIAPSAPPAPFPSALHIIAHMCCVFWQACVRDSLPHFLHWDSNPFTVPTTT